MEKVKEFILNGGVGEAAYRGIREKMHDSNRMIIRIFSLVAMVALGALFIASLAVSSLSGNRMLYGISFLISAAVWVLGTWPGKKNPAVLVADIYLFMALLMGFGIVLGTFLSPKELAATFIALLLSAPQVFTDRPWRMYCMILASVVAFILISNGVKDPATRSSDVTNVIAFGGISMILASYSISTRISRFCLEEEIILLAENDQLTGLKNRYCYQQSLEKVSVLESRDIYCVYVDVNGLHELNNTKGHEAGDRMLQYVATVMQNLFGKSETFRIGGDEFVALGLDKNAETVDRLVSELKQAVEAAGYHVATGVSFRFAPEIGIESMVKEAEKGMYSDKAAYYRQAGVDRRRR